MPWEHAADTLQHFLKLLCKASGANGYGGCDPVLPTHVMRERSPAAFCTSLRKKIVNPALAAAVGASVVLIADAVFYGGSLMSLRKIN